MSVTPALLAVALCFAGRPIPSVGRSAKRIAEGDPLESPEDLNTHYFVHLRQSWACVTNQATHELGGCLETNSCGGTLIHPEFVLTAQHCVSYREFYLKAFLDIYDSLSVHDVTGLSLEDLGFFTHVARGGAVVPNKPQSNHAFYSNVALLAGSTEYFGMTQKRHALKVFPHPVYYDVEGFSLVEHDVAIIQTCEPFQITAAVKTAPIKPLNKLSEQWESIVRRAATCLYMGFGETGEAAHKVYHDFNRGYLVKTADLRYMWRQTACPSKCRIQLEPDNADVNPCLTCSDGIPPRDGTALGGDSGGPVVCDGYYVGVLVAGRYEPEKNVSHNWFYPLHCLSKAVTPQALQYYRDVTPGEGRQVPLVLGDVPTKNTSYVLHH